VSEPFWDGEISSPDARRSYHEPEQKIMLAEPSLDPLQRIATALERIAAALERNR